MSSEHRPAYPRVLGLTALVPFAGCHAAVLDPAGPVGVAEKTLIITATIAMLIVVIPVIVLTLLFAWRYRATNDRAAYTPDWSRSLGIEIAVWAIPCAIIAFLAVISWRSTHALDPYKPLTAKNHAAPLTVDVVSLDWKWLFIYPDQHIAAVNELALPVNTPIDFNLTSDGVMNAFFIPRLGTQIYTMAGMRTKLHLIASRPGNFLGISANFSGDGFSGMDFHAIAMPNSQFSAWIHNAATSPQTLTKTAFLKLALPSENNPVAYFSAVDPTLFTAIIDAGAGGKPLAPHTMPPHSMASE